MPYYQGDDFVEFMTINLTNKETGEPIESAELATLQVGPICKTFNQPTFPLTVSLEREKTHLLSVKNNIYLAVYYYAEMDGERKLVKETCEGTLSLETKKEVVGCWGEDCSDGECNC